MELIMTTDLRPSPISGQWYPGDPRRLADNVDRYLRSAKLPEISGQIIAVMAPHAGHVYSGPVAGYAFAALQCTRPQVVAVIAPSHYPYPQPLLTTAHHGYKTPLGDVMVDQDLVKVLDAALQAELGFGLTAVRRDPEHALEIELPFLQRAFPMGFRLLPVMVREQTGLVTRALGKALASVLAGIPAVLVASTDLSHFYPQSEAKVYDEEILRRVEALDPEAVLHAEDEGRGFACGRGALAAVMWAAKELGANTAKVLHYATSGDITGDYSEVVGYGAAAFFHRSE